MTDSNITKDAMYGAVAPDDFESMIELDRYEQRSTAFDKIISATHDHFWDPLDKKYIDFDLPFDLENEALMPEEQQPILRLPYVAENLTDPKERIRFINYMQLWNFSSILHGEQGALNLSASLCHVLKDQGAQEYAANQTREEARHVTAFAKYIKSRWGRPVPCGSALKALLIEIIESPAVYKKIIGMQMLVEGLAMGAFANGYRYNRDPRRAQTLPTRDDRRGVPSQVRKDLGRQDDSEADRIRAQHGRGLGRALRAVAHLQQWLTRSSSRSSTANSASTPSACWPTSWSGARTRIPRSGSGARRTSSVS